MIEAIADELLRHPGGVGLAGAAVVAEVSWLTGEPKWAATTYECLRQRPSRHVTVGAGAFSIGASDRYLGQVTTLLRRFDEADAHFEAAHGLHEGSERRDGWPTGESTTHACSLRGAAQAMRRVHADLVTGACQTYRALGMAAHDQRAAALIETPEQFGTDAPAEIGVFVLEGEYWAMDYGGIEAQVRDSKGLRYLSRLLRAPGEEFHALDLVVGEGGGAGMSSGAARQAGLEATASGDAGAMLDPTAKAAYKRRLTELQDEVEEAAGHHDIGRVERAQSEIDFLIAELRAAVGLGGRDRKAASGAERARQSVTRAIKGAVERIWAAHPSLGEHLRTTVRTGIYSSYAPDPRVPIRWTSR